MGQTDVSLTKGPRYICLSYPLFNELLPTAIGFTNTNPSQFPLTAQLE